MYKILDNVATHGFNGMARVSNVDMKDEDLEIGHYTIHTPLLENGEFGPDERWEIVDVRQLKDGDPNPLLLYSSLINKCSQLLDVDKKVVVCCEAGQSRSNAIALGVLMTHRFHYTYYDALELIRKQVPIAMIDPFHLQAIRRIYDVDRNILKS